MPCFGKLSWCNLGKGNEFVELHESKQKQVSTHFCFFIKTLLEFVQFLIVPQLRDEIVAYPPKQAQLLKDNRGLQELNE